MATQRDRRLLFIALGSILLVALVVNIAPRFFQRSELPVQVVDDLPPYGEELRARAREGEERPNPPGAPTDPGPDRAPSWSADLKLVAVDAVEDDYWHTVEVWNRESGARDLIISIREHDPESGRSHRYSWSADSRVLFIYGWGPLRQNRSPGALCLAYLAAEKKLYQLRGCRPG
jgi:hypothetical protein